MNILCFDTSLNKTYISLLKDDEKKYKIIESDENNYHSAYLIKEIKNILNDNALDASNLDAVAVNAGPGSFTGIRVAMSVAKVLCARLDIKAIGINSMQILKEAYKSLSPAVILDARRGQFYVSSDTDKIKLIKYDDVKDLIQGKNIVCDLSSYEYLSKAGIKNLYVYENDDVNLGESLLNIALKKIKEGGNYSHTNLAPMYIQAPPIHGR